MTHKTVPPEFKRMTAAEIVAEVGNWDTHIGFWLPALAKRHQPTMRSLRNFLTDIAWNLAAPAPEPPGMAEIERALDEFGTACAEISRWSAARVADRKIELLSLIRALAQPRVPDALPRQEAETPYGECWRNGWNACRAAMLAAAPQPPTSGWLPIESAPKDGRVVLVFYRNAMDKARTITAFYAQADTLENEDGFDGEEFCPEGWYEKTWAGEQCYALEEWPTHWMPLPQPPTEASS